jgi:hypothetical protein
MRFAAGSRWCSKNTKGRLPPRPQQYVARSSARSVPAHVASSCARPYDLVGAVPRKHPTFCDGIPTPYPPACVERLFGKREG